MTVVFVLRHPETTWNVAERYQGRLESPLSPCGERQCRVTARLFLDQPIDSVYSSPLGRALHLGTAISAAADCPLVVDHRLTEVAQGSWEGLYRQEIEERDPGLRREWYARPDRVRFPGGETLREVRERVLSVLVEVFDRFHDGNVCVVTHSVVVQVLVAAALSLDLRYLHRLHISNAGISTFCGDAAPGSLRALNVTEHLHASAVIGARQHCGLPPDTRRIAS